MTNFDDPDRKIIQLLQRDATTSLETLAEQLGLSVNTCWRRVRRLEDNGVISHRVALCDPAKLGVEQTVFVAIKTRDHSTDWFEKFSKAVTEIAEVIEFYRMAGDIDYVLKVQVGSVSDYDRVYKTLIKRVDIADVSATFAMECLKNTTELPIPQ